MASKRRWLLANDPLNNEQRLYQRSQIGKVLDKLLDPRLELHCPHHADLEVTQAGTQVVPIVAEDKATAPEDRRCSLIPELGGRPLLAHGVCQAHPHPSHQRTLRSLPGT